MFLIGIKIKNRRILGKNLPVFILHSSYFPYFFLGAGVLGFVVAGVAAGF